jgi:hypothetical protein
VGAAHCRTGSHRGFGTARVDASAAPAMNDAQERRSLRGLVALARMCAATPSAVALAELRGTNRPFVAPSHRATLSSPARHTVGSAGNGRLVATWRLAALPSAVPDAEDRRPLCAARTVLVGAALSTAVRNAQIGLAHRALVAVAHRAAFAASMRDAECCRSACCSRAVHELTPDEVSLLPKTTSAITTYRFPPPCWMQNQEAPLAFLVHASKLHLR